MIPYRIALIALLIGWGAIDGQGQPRDTTSSSTPVHVVERVNDAFANGSSERLLGPATDRVEVSLFGTRTVYSSSQAFYVIRDFFSNYVPRRFQVDDVTETGTTCFVSGTYEHDQSERALQVFVRLVQQDEAEWRLHEVQIDYEAP
ncbi:MAG: DUF4783 domain-containing protein [Salinibacter sp.]